MKCNMLHSPLRPHPFHLTFDRIYVHLLGSAGVRNNEFETHDCLFGPFRKKLEVNHVVYANQAGYGALTTYGTGY